MTSAALVPKPLNWTLAALLNCAVFLFLAATGAHGQSDASGNQKLLDSGKFQEAKDLLETAVRSGRSSPENWLMLGAAYNALGSKGEARKAFEKVLESQPNASPALYNLGILSLEDGAYAEAAGYLRRLIDQNTNDLEGRFALAHALLKAGEPKQAGQYVDEALSIADENKAAYLRAAQIFIADGSPEQAENRLETGLTKWPNDEELKVTLAMAENQLGNDDRVVALLGTSSQPLQPQYAAVLGSSLFRLKRYSEAIPVLEKAISKSGGAFSEKIFDMLTRSYAVSGELENARQAAERSILQFGPQVSSLVAIANIFQLQKQDAEAIALLERYHSRFHTSSEYLFTLALSYHNLGSDSRAMELLKTVTALEPKMHQAYYLAGMCAASAGDLDGGISQLGAAVDVAPSHFLYQFQLGFLLSKAMRKSEAERFLVRSIELNPAHPPARYELARIYGDSGRIDAAIEQLQKALDADSQYEGAYYLLSQLYGKLGKPSEATSARHEFQRLQQARLQQKRDQGHVVAIEKR